MSEELKPCPFCGGKVEIFQDDNEEYCVLCVNCNSLHRYCYDTWAEFKTEAEAISSWNRRADIQKTCIFTYHDDLHCWECSECENAIFFASDSLNSPKDNDYRYCPFCGSKIIKEIRNYE